MWKSKFKIGQRVRVVKRINSWSYYGVSCGWDNIMDRTIGKVYTVIDISGEWGIGGCSGYRLNTGDDTIEEYTERWDSFYPEESLEVEIYVGQQLLFDFMKGEV